jgi:hypothetical protein
VYLSISALIEATFVVPSKICSRTLFWYAIMLFMSVLAGGFSIPGPTGVLGAVALVPEVSASLLGADGTADGLLIVEAAGALGTEISTGFGFFD